MPIYARSETTGLDSLISGVQNDLFIALSEKYNVNSSDIAIYPRVYKNPSESGGNKLEWWNGLDYKEVYLDDRLTISVFFVGDDTAKTKDRVVFSQDVSIIVIVNLYKLYSVDTTKRQTEKPDRKDHNIQYEFTRILDEVSYQRFEITDIKTEIPSIFGGLNVAKFKNDDMQPYHIFCIDTKMYYYITENC